MWLLVRMLIRRHLLRALILGSTVTAIGAVVACGSDDDDTTPGTDAGKDGSVVGDAGAKTDATTSDSGLTTGDAAITPDASDAGDAGPITLQFDPNGLGSPDAIYWDDTKQVLYIADDHGNQIWTYTDAAGFVKYATVPDDPFLTDAGKTKLNGITELADGTLVVTRFGYGTNGALYTVSPDGGSSASIPNVDATGRRIEVTSNPTTGFIYGDAFKGTTATAAGEVDLVNVTTGPTLYAKGFGKTVGLLVNGTSLLVSDQTNNVILAIPLDPTQIGASQTKLADGGAFPIYATVDGPDQLSAGPDGTIYTDEFLSNYDGGTPQVRQISADGGVTIPFPDQKFTSLSDVAYDAKNSRLFVADTNGSTVRTIKILPVSTSAMTGPR